MPNKTEDKDKLFKQIWMGFIANVGSLLIFSREISSLADRLDREKVHDLALDFSALFGDDPSQVEEELLEFSPSLESLEIYPDFSQRTDIQEALAFLQTGAFKKRAFDWALVHPSKAHKLVEIVNREFSEPSNSGMILRRSTLIHLVGFLEIFLQNLLFAYYYLHPEDGSVQQDEASLKKWAMRKAEARMKGNWKTKIQNIRTLGASLFSTETYLDELLEIVQRRHLMTHNDGVIDDYFLSNIPEKYKLEKTWKVGQVLVVSNEYLQRALDVVQLIGCALHQSAWRTWVSPSPKKANETFGNFIFASLQQERYQLVSDLADLSSYLALPKKHVHITKVNQAIAYRECGRNDKLQRLIYELDRFSPSLSVQIAVAVLRNDYKKTHLLLLQAVKKNQLWKISKDWPLFKPIANEPWFETMFIHADKGTLPSKR